jgi:hypothetical protein
MSKNRKPSGLIHQKNGVTYKLSKEIKTGKFFIRGTDIEVPPNKIRQPKNLGAKKSNYNFGKPFIAQDLGDEWSDYAWGADDY